MALRMWASSTANALRLSSKASLSPAFSLHRCFSSVLDGLKYAPSHEWVKHEGPVAAVGITDHAQAKAAGAQSFNISFVCRTVILSYENVCPIQKDHLGEVVFVDLPEPGGSVSKGASFGAVESVKATSDINSPISGEIVEVNTKLTETPGLVNSSPYEDGWMIKVKPSDPSELGSLMGPKEYTKFCEEENAAH